MAKLRRAGARWRLLVHEPRSTSHGVSDEPGKDREYYQHHHLPNTEFDELVVGRWLHIEQMNAKVWWMNISGVTIHVTVDRGGRPKQVTVHGPGDYASREDGVAYELVWSGQEAASVPPEEET